MATDTDAQGAAELVATILTGRVSERARKALTAYLLGTAAIRVGHQGYKWWKTRTKFTVSIDSTDEIYFDVQERLLDLIPADSRRSLTARSSSWRENILISHLSVDSMTVPAPESRLSLAYNGSEAQRITMGGHRILVSLTKVTDDAGYGRRPLETIEFTAQSRDAQLAVTAFLADVVQARHQIERAPSFYLAERWGEWCTRNDLPPRPLETVVLPEGQMQRLIDDMAMFRAAEHQYNRLGIPYHRGYLLHGPPRTGKTSIATALANHFGMDVYYLPLSDLTQDTTLVKLMAETRPGAMVLLEDVDVFSATADRDAVGDAKADEKDRVSLSGLLNSLDGLASPHGMVIVMTSNHPEKLDPAIIGPGRVDVDEHVGYLTDDQLAGLFQLAFGYDPTFPALPTDTELTAGGIVGILKRNLDSDVAAYSEICSLLAEHSRA